MSVLQHYLSCKQKGVYQRKLKDVLQEDPSTFMGHQVTGCPSTMINGPVKQFVDNIISNIQARFPETNILGAFGVLGMRPISSVPPAELAQWGVEQIKVLTEHYGQEQSHQWITEEKEQKTKTSLPVVDGEQTLEEWTELKGVVLAAQYPRDRMCALWELIKAYHGDEFPNMTKLAHLALSLPVHTAGCERGFSAKNLTLTKLRNRLAPETQDNILKVKIEGPADP